MARPPAEVDEKTVRALAVIGCTVEDIASILGVSSRLIHRRFRQVVKDGHANMRMSVRRNAFKRMQEGNVPMTIFLCKAVCGMRDNEPATIIQSNKETKVIRVFGAYERHAQAKDGK